MLGVKEFINADEIAKGLSPFAPEGAAFEAGRLMLQRIKQMIHEEKDFAFETTLATKSYTGYIKEAQKKGYIVILCFFWLDSVNLAVDRVNQRVKSGGHMVAEEVITRRYIRGLRNFFKIYASIVDYWIFLDKTINPFAIIAEGKGKQAWQIQLKAKWDKIKNYGAG